MIASTSASVGFVHEPSLMTKLYDNAHLNKPLVYLAKVSTS